MSEACSLGGLSPAYVNTYVGPPVPKNAMIQSRRRVQITTEDEVVTLDMVQAARLTEWLVRFNVYGKAPEPGTDWISWLDAD